MKIYLSNHLKTKHNESFEAKNTQKITVTKKLFHKNDRFFKCKIEQCPTFKGYLNKLKINPYELLATENTKEALSDYIRDGMFIHMPHIGNKKFGHVFYREFLKLKKTLCKLSDTDLIYEELRQLAERLSSKQTLDKAAQKQVSGRAIALGRNVKVLLQNNKIQIPMQGKFLDVGCGNGEVAKSIEQNLHINHKNVAGIEIIDRDDFCNIKRYSFNGTDIPSRLDKTDFVTIFNVLHHTQNEDEATMLLNSVYKSMKKGGFLLIRDHNALTQNDIKYWQVRHLLPIRVSKVDPPCLTQDTVYNSAQNWLNKLQIIGFKPKLLDTDTKKYKGIIHFIWV